MNSAKDTISKNLTLLTFLAAILGTGFCLIENQLRLLLPFYTILANSTLGLIVFFHNRKNYLNLSFAVTTFSVVGWTLAIFMYWETIDPAWALFWSKFAFSSVSLVPATFLFFTLLFPDKTGRKTVPGWIPGLIFTPAILQLIFIQFNLIVHGVTRVGSSLDVVPGLFYPLFTVYFVGYMLLAFVNLVRKNFTEKGTAKIEIRYVFFAYLLGSIFPIITNLILPLLVTTKFTKFGPSFTIIFVGITTYAITKHRLLDISVVISRAAAEVLTVGVLGAIYLVLLSLHQTYFSGQIDLFFVIWTVAYGVFVGQIFMKLRLFFQTTSDKLFLRGKYDYYKALAGVGEQITKTLSMENIILTIKKTFSEIMEVSNPRLLLAEAEIKPYLQYKQITQVGDDLVVPCRLEERLIAVFVLGPKLSEDTYTDEDLRLLSALASQAAVAIDHTRSYERIKEDLLATEKQLERSQRLASIGTLTAGVTHEIRNPMTVIRAKVESLFDQVRDAAYLKEAQAVALQNIDRVENIIQGMLNLSKNKEQKVSEEIDLVEKIEEALTFFTKSRLKVIKEFKPIPKVKGVKIELSQAIINIIQNAIEAMPEGGTLTLKTYLEGDRPVVEVSDTGKGIPIEIREKIFDPFFSSRHEGTGLGLSIVYRIIREHGGDIKVESEVGKGSTFKLLF